jgi:hypothetical protein
VCSAQVTRFLEDQRQSLLHDALFQRKSHSATSICGDFKEISFLSVMTSEQITSLFAAGSFVLISFTRDTL